MGEMADMLFDQMMDFEELVMDYQTGMMSERQAYDYGIVGNDGGVVQGSTHKTCRCCGKGGLLWATSGGKWRLFEDGAVHDCPKNPLNDTGR